MDSDVIHPLDGAVSRREFRKLWAASAASNLGDGVWLVAAPLLAASLTRNPMLVAGLGFAQRLPWLIFPLLSGAVADRIDRRRTMVMVALFRAACVATLGIAIVADRASLPLLYGVFFLIATGETLFDTAASTVLPSIVPPDRLPRANAQLAGMVTATNQFVGPPMGGLLFAKAAFLPFLLGAGGLSVSARLLMTLRGSFKVERDRDATPTDLRAEIGEGVRWLWQHRLLRTTALALGVLNLTLVAQVSIMVLFAEERLGLGPRGYGLLLTAYGAGGVLGGLIAGEVLGHLGESSYLRLAIAIEAATPATIALTREPIVVGVAFVCFSVHATVWGALLSSLRQSLTPDRLRGRVSSVHALVENGTAAPGALLGGILASRLGLTAPFWLGAVTGALLLPLAWSSFSNESIDAARRQASGVRS